jgi:protease-4
VTPLADGRVFSGRQAKEAKLVDELGGIEAAVAEAGKLGGITGEPKTEYPKKERKLLRELMGDDEEIEGLARTVLGRLAGASVQYRMEP